MSTVVALSIGAAIGLSIAIAFIVLAPAASDFGDAVSRSCPLARALTALAVALAIGAALALIFIDTLAGALTAIVALEAGIGATLVSRRQRTPMSSKEPYADLLTLEQVCELLEAPSSSIAALVARDAIPYRRPAKGIKRFRAEELRFPRDEIEAWLRQGRR